MIHQCRLLGSVFVGFALVAGCAVPTSSNADAPEVEGTESTSQADNYCNNLLVDHVSASYERAFGRLPDTGEGAGANELAYWCGLSDINSFTDDALVRWHARWLREHQDSREAMIKRAYRVSLGREPVPCEIAYWNQNIGVRASTFEDLVKLNAEFGALYGYRWRNEDLGDLLRETYGGNRWVATGRWGYTCGYVPITGC